MPSTLLKAYLLSICRHTLLTQIAYYKRWKIAGNLGEIVSQIYEKTKIKLLCGLLRKNKTKQTKQNNKIGFI